MRRYQSCLLLIVFMAFSHAFAQDARSLWDQNNEKDGEGILSNQPEVEHIAFETQVADDFIIPDDEIWRISDLRFFWAIGSRDRNHRANIVIYKDDNGRPGEPIISLENVKYSSTLELENLFFPSEPFVLGGGHYWIMFQAKVSQDDLDGFFFDGGFRWTLRREKTGHSAVYRNPGNGYERSCQEWTPLLECGYEYPDVVFEVRGFLEKVPNCTDPLDIPSSPFLEFLIQQFDTDEDQVLCPFEISQMTQLDVSGMDFDNLNGLQFLTALTSLNCSDNHLAALPDLSGLTRLVHLNCENNQLSALPALPASIEVLDASNNHLTHVPSPATLPALQSIDVSLNRLTPDDCPQINLLLAAVETAQVNPQISGNVSCGDQPKIVIHRPSQKPNFGTFKSRLTFSGSLISTVRPASFIWRLNNTSGDVYWEEDHENENKWNWFIFDLDLRLVSNNLTITMVNQNNLEAQLQTTIVRAQEDDLAGPKITEVDFPMRMSENDTKKFSIRVEQGNQDLSQVEWNFNDGDVHQFKDAVLGINSINDSILRPGNYEIETRVFDTLTFYDEARRQLEVFPENTPPVITSVSATPARVKVGEPIRFQALARDEENNQLQYHWIFDDGNYRITTNPELEHIYNQSRDYEVTLLVSDLLSDAPARTLTVTVDPAAAAQVGLDPSHLDLSKRFNEIHPSVSFEIFNAGGGELTYETQLILEDEPDKQWIKLSGDESGSLSGDERGVLVLSFENSNSLNINSRGYRARVTVTAPGVERDFDILLDVLGNAPQLRVTSPSSGKLDAEWRHFNGANLAYYLLSACPVNSDIPVTFIQTFESRGQLIGLDADRTYRVKVETFDHNNILLGETGVFAKTKEVDDTYLTQIPHVAQNPHFWTGLAMVNPNSEQAGLTIEAFDASGACLEAVEFGLGANQKRIHLVDGLFPDHYQDIKRLEISATRPVISLELFGDHQNQFMAGVPANDNAAYSATMIVDQTPGIDGVYHAVGLANPGKNHDVLVKVTAHDEFGFPLIRTRIELRHGQQVAHTLTGLLGSDHPLLERVRWIEFTALSPFYGFKLSGGNGFMNGGSLLGSGTLDGVVPLLERDNSLYLVNTEQVTNRIELTIRNFDGETLYRQSLLLGPRQMTRFISPATGWVQIQSNAPVVTDATISRTFLDKAGKTVDIISEQVPGQGRFNSALTIPHTPSNENFSTELVLINKKEVATRVRISGFGGGKSQSLVLDLPPLGGIQKTMNALFPSTQIEYVRVTGFEDDELAALALFFTRPGKGSRRMGAYLADPE